MYGISINPEDLSPILNLTAPFILLLRIFANLIESVKCLQTVASFVGYVGQNIVPKHKFLFYNNRDQRAGTCYTGLEVVLFICKMMPNFFLMHLMSQVKFLQEARERPESNSAAQNVETRSENMITMHTFSLTLRSRDSSLNGRTGTGFLGILGVWIFLSLTRK